MNFRVCEWKRKIEKEGGDLEMKGQGIGCRTVMENVYDSLVVWYLFTCVDHTTKEGVYTLGFHPRN